MTTAQKTYPKYKDSGIEWVRHIPVDWTHDKIVSLFNFPNDKVSDVDFEPLSVTYGGVKKQVEDAAKTDNGSNRKLLKIGDIAFNGRSDRRGACGMSEYEGSISVVYHVLRKRSSVVHVPYFHHLFRNTLFSQEFYRWGRGIHDDMWTTRILEMKRIQVPVPPLETQKKISNFLDERTEAIDELVAKKERMIELLREKRESLITQIVTRGLDPSVKMKSTGSDWLEKVPSGWEKIPLKFLFSYQSGGVWGDEARNDENDAICVRVADFDFIEFVAHSDDFTYRNLPDLKKSLVLDENSILLEKSGGGDQQPVGRAVRYLGTERATCSNFIQKLQVDKKYSSEFVILLLSMLYFNGVTMKVIKKTTGIQNLDLGAFLRTDVFLPSADEQRRIVEFINTKSLIMTAAMKETKKQIEQLKEYRSSLIYSAVTGKIKI